MLLEHGIKSQLHIALINNEPCHRLLSVKIEQQKYFIDVGSGWPCIRLFPSYKPFQYSAFGIHFRSTVKNDHLNIEIKTNDVFKPLMLIPFETPNEAQILKIISQRYNALDNYPFKDSLRFSIVYFDTFYFIKKNTLRIYQAEKPYQTKELSITQIMQVIYKIYPQNTFQNTWTPFNEKEINELL